MLAELGWPGPARQPPGALLCQPSHRGLRPRTWLCLVFGPLLQVVPSLDRAPPSLPEVNLGSLQGADAPSPLSPLEPALPVQLHTCLQVSRSLAPALDRGCFYWTLPARALVWKQRLRVETWLPRGCTPRLWGWDPPAGPSQPKAGSRSSAQLFPRPRPPRAPSVASTLASGESSRP